MRSIILLAFAANIHGKGLVTNPFSSLQRRIYRSQVYGPGYHIKQNPPSATLADGYRQFDFEEATGPTPAPPAPEAATVEFNAKESSKPRSFYRFPLETAARAAEKAAAKAKVEASEAVAAPAAGSNVKAAHSRVLELTSPLPSSQPPEVGQSITLAKFDGSLTLTPWQWETVNDPVMGGQSNSAFRVSFGLGIWDGAVRNVPLLNAPGFCIVQAPGLGKAGAYADMADTDGILVQAQQIVPSGISSFNVQIRTKGARSSTGQQGVYAADFTMPYDSESKMQENFLPWSAFKCTFLGETVSWCPDIKTQLGGITNIGLGTSYPGESGSFQVGIASVSAVQLRTNLTPDKYSSPDGRGPSRPTEGPVSSPSLLSSSTIAVIGAGGATGLECVRRLLAHGASVRCVVRDPDKYAGKFGSAEVVQGSVTDGSSMEAALEGTDGVIFAASASEPFGPGGPYEVDYLGVGKAAKAAKAQGIQKFVLVSSRLVDPVNQFNPIRVLLNNVNRVMDYKFMGEEELRSSGLDQYVIVRPGGLAGGEGRSGRSTDIQPGTQELIAGAAEADLGGSGGSIHRADVAAVICEALACPDAACKTIEIVAKPTSGERPTIEQQLACVFEAIPQDTKTSSSVALSALGSRDNHDGVEYFFPGLLPLAIVMVSLIIFKKFSSFWKRVPRLQKPLMHTAV